MSVQSGPLLSRRPLQYVLTLAPGFIAAGAQSVSSTTSSASAIRTQVLDDDDSDDDGEDGDNSSTRTHTRSSTRTSSSSSTATGSGASSASATSSTSAISSGSSKHGLQGGSIAALVFGILVLLLIIGAGLLFWLRRRRRLLAEARADSNDGSQVNTALISRDPVSVQSPTSPTSAGTAPWIPPVYMAVGPVNDHGSDPEHGDQSQDNHGRASSSIHTLPNPHESYRDTPHSRSTTTRTTSMSSDRDLPPLPDSSLSFRPTSATSSLFGALSTAPSAFTYPSFASQAPTASTDATTAPSITSASSLPTEEAGPSTTGSGAEAAIMADYQKRLESHHRKESEDAAAGSGGVPVDPPPRYSESDQAHQS